METKQSLDTRFVAALREHRTAMYRLAVTMLKSPADAEDAVSAATLSAYRAAGRIRDWNAIKPYLMRVTVNACHSMLRRRKREIALADPAVLEEIPAGEEMPIWMYTQQLPVPIRTVLQMRYGEGMRVTDIARALRVPKGTVSSRLSRGQKLLRDLMEEEGFLTKSPDGAISSNSRHRKEGL